MRYGITMFTTDQSMAIIELARAVEARGFDSLWVPEHTHIPISRRTPPPTGGHELADEYKRTLDPFIALTAAAAVTTRIRVGTGISVVAQHEPIVTAKMIATLDLISQGRFDFGVGFGWNHDEIENHGIDVEDRRDIARENVLAMRSLWRDEVGSFDGEHVHIAPSWSWPKPVQRPQPPILVGGAAGPKLFAHIAEYGDGWIPIGGAGLTAGIPQLRRVVEAAGRDPDDLRIVPFGSIPDPGKLEHFAAIGVTEVILRLPSAPADEALRVLDRWTGLIPD